MNRTVIIALQIPLFILGIVLGTTITDIERNNKSTSDIAKCSSLDTRKLCNAKINLNKAIEELNNAY